MNTNNIFLNRFMTIYAHSPYLYIWRAAEASAIAKLISKHHLDADHILDIGCGDGIFSSVLFDKIFTGSDLSCRSLRKALASGLYLNNIRADATNLPFKNESFEMCFSNCVFEHIINDNRAFSEASRVLKIDGYFLITIPSDDFESMLPGYFMKTLFPVFWKKLTVRIDHSLMHYHYYNINSLERKLKELGLRLIDYEPYVSLRQFRIFFILRTIESVFRTIKLQKINVMLSRIFKRFIKSCQENISNDSGKHGGIAILCKRN